MSDELREKVAAAACDAVNGDGAWAETPQHHKPQWYTIADAAIALAGDAKLEEAAKAVDKKWGKFHDSDVVDILEIIRSFKKRAA